MVLWEFDLISFLFFYSLLKEKKYMQPFLHTEMSSKKFKYVKVYFFAKISYDSYVGS